MKTPRRRAAAGVPAEFFLFRNLRHLLACHAVVVLVKAGAIRRLSGRATERQARRAARTKAVRSVLARPSDMLSAEDATQVSSVFVLVQSE